MASPPIPNRSNPKPRNSEADDPLRRSFGGNLFPADSRINISSGFSRRNSFGGRENSQVDYSDKENETKALSTPKGSKNFMSPTISAVSKINSSPRKKVLSDKNDLPRSAVSLSDCKGLILEDTKSHHQAKSCISFSDVINNEKKRFERSHDMTVTDFDENEVHENKEIVYSDPRFRISPRPSIPYRSPEFAAPEVDTLLPPYDPKKNYLSPRPQFLHYRPNPRIENHFDECKQLEELLISESSFETELSALECANAYHKGGVEEVEEEEVKVSEQLDATSDEEMVCESTEETSQFPKQFGFRKFKFLGWFLALVIAYLLVSATFSPATKLVGHSPIYEFHITREITELAKANNFKQLSEKLWTLTESSLVYMDKLISRLRGGEEEHGPLQFHNLTYILEDNIVFQPTNVEINGKPLQDKGRGERSLEDGIDNEFEEESGGEENSEVICETKDGDAETNEFDEQTKMKSGTGTELSEVEGNLEAIFEDGIESEEVNHEEKDGIESEEVNHEEKDGIELSEVEGNLEAIFEDGIESEVVNHEEKDGAGGSESQDKLETGSTEKDQKELEEAESESVYINQQDVESIAINVHQKKESEVADAESESEEALRETASETSDDLHPKVRSYNNAILVLSSTVLVLLAAVTFLFAKKAKPVDASAHEPAPETKELNLCHFPVENLMKENLSPLNFQEELDDRISMSFHNKRSFHKDPKEYQTSEGKKSNNSSKLRRESMASSASEYSVGSFSYGSFTSYEKVPIKTGDKEEEIITPVRRSSRIRNYQPSGL